MTIKNKSEIIKYLENHTWKETANNFNVSEMTLSRALKGNVSVYNKLKSRIQTVFNKPLNSMNINTLRFIHFMLTNKNLSMTRNEYVSRIKKLI